MGGFNFNLKTFKSLEFVVLILSNAGVWLTSIASDRVGSNSAVYWTAASVGVYALARGLAKMSADTKDYWNTSEFWMNLIGAVVATVAALQDTISPHTYGVIMATLTALAAIGNGLRKVPAVQAAATDPPTDYGPYVPDPGDVI